MKKLFTAAALIPALPFIASAHPSHGIGGFTAGLSHPILGMDHLLAMLCIGILAFQMGGRSRWILPASFVLATAAGSLVGMAGLPLFSVEAGIALSVVLLGMVLAFQIRIPVLPAVSFAAMLALLHGHAHGTEMPFLSQPLLYVTGLTLGTALIHGAGLLTGSLCGQLRYGRLALRAAGLGMAAFGLHTLLG